MANYFEMSKDQLRAEKAALEQSYAEFKAKGLKLNMARGKPGPHQMDLAMDLLKMSDYTTEDGYDARNYGNLEGLEEARALFGISNDIAMQMVGVGFIIGVVQDSVETALNSAGDVEFAATAEYHQWRKEGKPLPDFLQKK